MISAIALMGALVLFGQVPPKTWSRFGPFDSRPYLTPTSTPVSSVNISWNTVVLDSTVVAYGLTAALGETVRLSGRRNFHHITIEGLQPDNEYWYRVLPGGSLKRFRTFPVRSDRFDFIAFGDTRTDSAAHQSIIDRMIDFPHRFITRVQFRSATLEEERIMGYTKRLWDKSISTYLWKSEKRLRLCV